ncbi:MAG: penicillin acylase family protein [Alphaproteobacteria bacterium]
MRRVLRFLGFGVAGLLAALLIAAVAGWFWLQTSLPRLDGAIALEGLSAPVMITRDGRGIPYIRAESARDGAFALGFVHAQDRFAQMEMTRRIGAGRMAELLGSEMVPMDRTMRTYGIHRLAQQDAAGLPDDVRAMLDAYAAGVNAWMDARDGALPPEFYALWLDPEPWTPADSLIWIRLMALRLTDNWNAELLRATLRRHLTEAQIAALFPEPRPDDPTTIARDGTRAVRHAWAPPSSPIPAFMSDIAAHDPWRLAGPAWQAPGGSNAWALAGARTTTGAPILANDPHLGMGVPGVWYLARIDTPEGTLAGATAPGLPYMILGHNGRVAWGLTTTHGDASDLAVERLDGDDEGLYETPDGLQPLEIRNEVVRVRFADDVLLKIRSSRHGPVVSDIDPAAAAAAGDGHVLALTHAGLLPGDPGVAALHRVNRAGDVDAVREALRAMRAPQQNVMYADTAGGIALSMPARVPIRRSGDGTDIVPGWTGRHDWTGFVPFEELPHIRDPQSGIIVNANNRLVGPEYPHFISRFWPEAYRAARIETVLGKAERTDLDHSTALQLDAHEGAADDLLPDMLAAVDAASFDPDLLAGLRDWDRAMAVDRWEPLVYQMWLHETARAIFSDDLGSTFQSWWTERPAVLRRVLREDPVWCDRRQTPEAESCPEIVAGALGAALERLARLYGPDWTRWRWGDAHAAVFSHVLFGRIPGLQALTDIRVPVSGGRHTVNRGGFVIGDDDTFRMAFGPGYRAVYDLADLDRSRFVAVPGQSGNPLSPHYADMIDDWRDGRYLTLVPPTEPAHELRLLPAGSAP